MLFGLENFVMDSGERYCVLFDKRTFEPLYYPNLYVTTQVRNPSLSLSVMKSSLSAIAVFMEFLSLRSITQEGLEIRLRSQSFFDEYEYDLLSDFCQKNFSRHGSQSLVSKHVKYVRMTVIAEYVVWLSRILLQKQTNIEKLKGFERAVKSRRPKSKGRNQLLEKGLTSEQSQLLLKVLNPDSKLNPFVDEATKNRNKLMILLLHYLGVRGGELLNIRVRDIDFQRNQILIARRSDDPDDLRLYQPLVKTLDRRLPVSDLVVHEIYRYITCYRRSACRNKKHDYLFVVHKSGPTEGYPVSLSSYKKIFSIIRKTSHHLRNVSAHKLRHSWNERFSQQLDEMTTPLSEQEQEKMRSYLMGWKEGSGTSAIYNRRFVRRKSEKAALSLQAGLTRVPSNIGENVNE